MIGSRYFRAMLRTGKLSKSFAILVLLSVQLGVAEDKDVVPKSLAKTPKSGFIGKDVNGPSDFFSSALEVDQLDPGQRTNFERVNKDSPGSFAVLSDDFQDLRKILQKSLLLDAKKKRPVVTVWKDLALFAVATRFEDFGTHFTWAGRIVSVEDVQKTNQKPKDLGSIVLSIFREKVTGKVNVWGRITKDQGVLIIRPLGGGAQVIIPKVRKPNFGKNALEKNSSSDFFSLRHLMKTSGGYTKNRSSQNRHRGSNHVCASLVKPNACSVANASTDPCPIFPAGTPEIKVGFLARATDGGDEEVLFDNYFEYAAHVVDLANTASQCSHSKAKFVLGAVQEVVFPEKPSRDEYIDAFKACEAFYTNKEGECELSTIYDWRKNSKSDIVVIVSRMEFQGNFVVGTSKFLAFSVVGVSSVGYYDSESVERELGLLAVHEIGHIFGASHDRQWIIKNPQGDEEGDFKPICNYSHGFFDNESFCTVMGSNNNCIPDVWWSTPKIQFNEIVIGSCANEDVARTISERAKEVSNYQ